MSGKGISMPLETSSPQIFVTCKKEKHKHFSWVAVRSVSEMFILFVEVSDRNPWICFNGLFLEKVEKLFQPIGNFVYSFQIPCIGLDRLGSLLSPHQTGANSPSYKCPWYSMTLESVLNSDFECNSLHKSAMSRYGSTWVSMFYG